MSTPVATILPAGTPVHVSDPISRTRSMRHDATIVRPMRDYGRPTASHYVVRLWSGQERVYSSDFVTGR